MKFFLLSSILVVFTVSCSNRAVYDAIHERERQECLKQGRADCPRGESYDKYKSQRDEEIQYDNTGNIK